MSLGSAVLDAIETGEVEAVNVRDRAIEQQEVVDRVGEVRRVVLPGLRRSRH